MRNFVVLVKYHGRGRGMNLDGEYVANGLEYVYHVNTAAFWNTNTTYYTYSKRIPRIPSGRNTWNHAILRAI